MNQSSCNVVPGQGRGSGEETHILGLEVRLPLVNDFPGLPAGNYAGSLILAAFIKFALEEEGLLCNGVAVVGGLNGCSFAAQVRCLPKSYRVLEEILSRCPFLRAISTFGYFCPRELIWRAVYPRPTAPFGQQLNLEQMLASNLGFKAAFNAAVESEIARLEEQIARPIVTGSTIFSAQSSPSSP